MTDGTLSLSGRAGVPTAIRPHLLVLGELILNESQYDAALAHCALMGAVSMIAATPARLTQVRIWRIGVSQLRALVILRYHDCSPRLDIASKGHRRGRVSLRPAELSSWGLDLAHSPRRTSLTWTGRCGAPDAAELAAASSAMLGVGVLAAGPECGPR